MEDEYTSRLHSVALSESDESKKISDDKPSEMNVYKIYDENDCLLCKCLNWCSWLSNIDCKKSTCCERNIICFICCCSITFQ
jgi:hypothetical protein